MNPLKITLLSIALGCAINIFLIQRLQKFRQTDTYRNNQGGFIGFLKYEEEMALKFQNSIQKLANSLRFQRINPAYIIELILIGVWAFWIGREYLSFDPNIIPNGR